ncbi:MAG: alpha-D-ribose 1-methylphosphonate 5-triphosphate diphosphatase [Burkholderiales bacterium]
MQFLSNARIVLDDRILHGTVAIDNGRIVEITPDVHSRRDGVDFDGDYLAPGFVEIHTDNLERHLMPRPGTYWPALPALIAHDAEIAAAGITTVFDAIGVGDTDLEGLRGQNPDQLLGAFATARRRGVLRADHRLHIRCEVPAPNMWALFAPFASERTVGLLSLMDHTPGQRQWTSIDPARRYYTGKKAWTNERFDQALADAPQLQARYAQPNRDRIVTHARKNGVVLASHDDTLPEHVKEARDAGARISEFPTTVVAAAEARLQGMSIVMGAPNVVRGGSHSGNVSAIELAQLGLLDVLSSDYVPAGLLHAAMRLTRDAGFGMPAAIATISRNPAMAVGLFDRGSIQPGMQADLVRFAVIEDQPIVRTVWRAGERIS